MLENTFTQTNLRTTFRMLSNKKRHGMLSILSPHADIQVWLHSGRIVHVRRKDESAGVEICVRLAEAGFLSQDIVERSKELDMSVDELCSSLVEKDLVSSEEFVNAKRAYELNLLHSLRSVQEGSYSFTPELVKYNPELSLLVYPCQLLLDFYELNATDDEFKETFGSLSKSSVYVHRRVGEERELTEKESHCWGFLEVESQLSRIAELTLLSEFELRSVLLALRSRSCIEVEILDEAQPIEEIQPAEPFSFSEKDSLFGTFGEESSASQTEVLQDEVLEDELEIQIEEDEFFKEDSDLPPLEVNFEEETEETFVFRPKGQDATSSYTALTFLLLFALTGPFVLERWLLTVQQFTAALQFFPK